MIVAAYGVHDVLNEVIVEVGHHLCVILHGCLTGSDSVTTGGLGDASLVLKCVAMRHLIRLCFCFFDTTRDIGTLPVEVKSFDLLSVMGLCFSLGKVFAFHNLGALKVVVSCMRDFILAKGDCFMV